MPLADQPRNPPDADTIEAIARATIAGLPPECFPVGARTVAHPREPAGGTWISVHDRGAAFTLVNWYAITACAPQPVASRGEVVLALRGSESVDASAGVQAAAAAIAAAADANAVRVDGGLCSSGGEVRRGG